MLKLHCDECGKEVNVVDGVTAIFQRGYWWCSKHVSVSYWEGGNPVVDFPSPGKLFPKTILKAGCPNPSEQK